MKKLTENEKVKYEVSKDGTGLLAYFEDGNFYHIHSDELTKLEKWILEMLKGIEKLADIIAEFVGR